MSMSGQNLSSRRFQQKILEFCELRIAPIVPLQVLENIRPYLISLIIHRKSPPMSKGRVDWVAFAQTCGVEDELTTELKKQLRVGLDAIMRWVGALPATKGTR